MHNETRLEKGRAELRRVRAESRWLLWTAALFSVFINLLMLTGPLFMLQIYDRVLGSRSEETLLALFILMAFLFATMGVLEYLRGRVLARIGAALQARLEGRVFHAVLARAALSPRPDLVANSLRDLDAVQRFVAAPVFAAIFDLPFTPLFLAGILLFHLYLGVLALVGGAILILFAILNQVLTRAPSQEATLATISADQQAHQIKNEAEMVRALGMQESAFHRWQQARSTASVTNLEFSDKGGLFSTLSRTFRMFLQSAMLGLAAWLVLKGEVSARPRICWSRT